MNEHKKYLPSKEECKHWTLFLDRDGVINKYIPSDYAKNKSDFILNHGVIKAISDLKMIFRRIILVTNQQGVGKGVMTEADLENVHLKLYNSLKDKGVSYFDASFYAPYLREKKHNWRKPATGMIFKGQEYFSDIDLNKCVMVGDSPGDMLLAHNIGAVRVKIENSEFEYDNQDYSFPDLTEFVYYLS